MIDKQAEIINRVQIEHISLRTKLMISFNWGKISTGVKKSYFCHMFHLRPKKVMGGWVLWGGLGGLSKNLVRPWA